MGIGIRRLESRRSMSRKRSGRNLRRVKRLAVWAALALAAPLSAQVNSQGAANLMIPHASWNCGMPEGIPSPEAGVLVFEAQMILDGIYNIGRTPFGERRVLVARDGTFSGPRLSGAVMPGALDFELTLSNGVLEIEQLFVLQTSDGDYIYVRNAGTGSGAGDVRVVMDFEAPNESSSAWLNTGTLVARRTVDVDANTMALRVYDVSSVSASGNPIRIQKPAGVPQQPWDYREADASEQRGAELITESVALSPSQRVGESKRGMRNVIPITGGELTGRITGKVLFGGADYQHLTPPATIDARYLWQAEDGEVIIVRNGGAFGSLVPTFEARVDGPYAWLNDGKFLSSNPGGIEGGVGITMYESTN